ncbi:hypothetical protein KFL_002090060 [Klebsormidium nitens]|uniref:F-box domain-containing protein n=1 Tax=Klebsormidium nitens TaxID=105231 RepID=A0A1Y1I1R2_KLENI|nr:hypothetical protein KFL_002090060 [Klebsormidium nitens]|eukprot:GAQ84854.1 hypothetical protein KFL_002090060 [Klebsormidium nitens]
MATLDAASSLVDTDKRGEALPVIDCLGDDLLCLVLGRLSTRPLLQSPALVCKRWSQLCKALVTVFSPPRFLAKLPASKSSTWLHLRGPEAARIVERHAATLETLDLRYLGAAAKHSPSSEERILLPRLPRLRTMVLPALEFGRQLDLTVLPRSLTTLRFAFEPHSYATPAALPTCAWCWLDNAGLRTIRERCPNLESVAFGVCHDRITTTDTRPFLAALSPTLKTVSLQYGEVEGVQDRTLRLWDDLAFILRTCQCLESLEVQGPVFRLYPEISGWADGPTREPPALSFPPRLRELRLLEQGDTRNRFTQYGLRLLEPAVRAQGHQLHAFQASANQIDGPERWDWSWTPNLRVLDWGNTFWMRASNIRFSKRAARSLLETLLLLPRLERVVLADATDEMLVALGQHCPRLREIHIHGPEFALRPVEGLPRYPRVEEVTNRGVIALAEGCPHLRVVDVGHSLVSVGAVRALAFHCRELQVLILTGCRPTPTLPGIADDAVVALLPRLGSCLHLLDLAGTGVTAAALQAIADWGQEHPFPLRVLVLPSRPAIQKSSWAAQLKARPGLDVRFGSSGIRWAGLHESPLLED